MLCLKIFALAPFLYSIIINQNFHFVNIVYYKKEDILMYIQVTKVISPSVQNFLLSFDLFPHRIPAPEDNLHLAV